MSDKKITLEQIDALINESVARLKARGVTFGAEQKPLDASHGSLSASGKLTLHPHPQKRMDPAVQMRLEMNRLGIKSDDKRQFTLDLVGRLMYYGEDHIPRYVETDTRTPLGAEVVSPLGVVSSETEAKLRERGCAAHFEPSPPTASDVERMKAKQWRKGDRVQIGVPGTDEFDTGQVVSSFQGHVRVFWDVANTTFKEAPDDLEMWSGEHAVKRSAAQPGTDEHDTGVALTIQPPRPAVEVVSEPFLTREGLAARVVKPRSTEDQLHEWHETHGRETSLPNRDK